MARSIKCKRSHIHLHMSLHEVSPLLLSLKNICSWPAAFECRLPPYDKHSNKSTLSAKNVAVASQVQAPVALQKQALTKGGKNQGLRKSGLTVVMQSYSVGCNSVQDLCLKQSKFTCFHILWANSQKSKRSLPAAFGHIYAACLFFTLWLPNFSPQAFKLFSQNPTKHGLTNQSFCIIFN